jgi:hypothetical protein
VSRFPSAPFRPPFTLSLFKSLKRKKKKGIEGKKRAHSDPDPVLLAFRICLFFNPRIPHVKKGYSEDCRGP